MGDADAGPRPKRLSGKRYDAELAHDAAVADEELKALLDTQPPVGTRLVQDVPAALRSIVAPLAA